MKLIFDERGSLEALENALASLVHTPDTGTLMILGCVGNDWPKARLDPILQSLDRPVFGGLFPNIVFRSCSYQTGLLVVGFRDRADLAVVTGLSDVNIDLSDALERQTRTWTGVPETSTMAVFVDGMAQRIEPFVQELFFSFGLDNSFIGGGAGSLDFDSAACILCPDGLLADAAVCARLPMTTSIGVRHGWEPASELMVVTESHRNVIHALDHEAALPAYQRILAQHGCPDLTAANFFEQARCFPFGIQKTVADTIIRDPVRVDEDGGLICVGAVPRGSTVRVMTGSRASLISAAREARANVDEYMLNTRGSCYLVIDCISRTLVLGEGMQEELATVSQEDLTFGAFTLGEIANTGQEFLEFYNKTIVVARFDETLEP